MPNYDGIFVGEVVERDANGKHTVEFGFGTVGGNFATFRLEIAVDDPNEYKTLPKGTQVLVGFIGGRSQLPVLLGVLRRGHDDEFPLDHVDDDVKVYAAGLRRKVSGEDGKVTLSKESESASTIEIEVENDIKITIASSKKIQVHGENIELGGEAAKYLLNEAAKLAYNTHGHKALFVEPPVPATMFPTTLMTAAHVTKKVKAE